MHYFPHNNIENVIISIDNKKNCHLSKTLLKFHFVRIVNKVMILKWNSIYRKQLINTINIKKNKQNNNHILRNFQSLKFSFKKKKTF